VKASDSQAHLGGLDGGVKKGSTVGRRNDLPEGGGGGARRGPGGGPASAPYSRFPRGCSVALPHREQKQGGGTKGKAPSPAPSLPAGKEQRKSTCALSESLLTRA